MTAVASIQTMLIREIQAESGHAACYATPAALACPKKQSECPWRHDCFEEAGAADTLPASISRPHAL